jgi:peptidoglycan hydrolase-like protein with peptidoglycan-binding domain
MRLTTITALASIVAAIAIGPSAIAQPYSQNSTQTEKAVNFRERNSLANRLSETQELGDFMIARRESGALSSETGDRRKLFSEPFYPSAAQRRYEEKSFSLGERGSHIWILQRRLLAQGFEPGPVDSVFGSKTQQAVKAFQESQGLTVTGVVDETTWKALTLNKGQVSPRQQVSEKPSVSRQLRVSQEKSVSQETILDKGNKGSKVKTLQLRLDIQGYDPGPIDGVFGGKTAAAVKQFQEAQGLTTSGVVDEATWEALGRN